MIIVNHFLIANVTNSQPTRNDGQCGFILPVNDGQCWFMMIDIDYAGWWWLIGDELISNWWSVMVISSILIVSKLLNELGGRIVDMVNDGWYWLIMMNNHSVSLWFMMFIRVGNGQPWLVIRTMVHHGANNFHGLNHGSWNSSWCWIILLNGWYMLTPGDISSER